MADISERIADLVAQPVQSRGLDLEFVEHRGVGNRTQVRIGVDRDGGVDLDEIADLSREISAVLDQHDSLFSGQYVLEVGSPGVSRPLTLPRHWRRNIGRLVKVSTADSTVIGRLTAADEQDVTIEFDDQTVEIAISDVLRAVVQVELNRGKDT